MVKRFLLTFDKAKALRLLIDEFVPRKSAAPRERLMPSIADRPAPDLRYATDPARICSELDWQPCEALTSGLRKTVETVGATTRVLSAVSHAIACHVT